MPRSPLVLATRNPGKVSEIRALLAGLPLDPVPASDFPGSPEVEEDLPDLEGNARKKAQALFAHTGAMTIADDTGLEVAVLGGRPGVHSARYAGPQADDAANRKKLLAELDGVEDRRAHFRTIVAFIDLGGVHFFEGICEGHILDRERGSGGFGYDALFVPEGYDRTFAELNSEEKNAISHRGKAFRALRAFLEERYAI